MPESVRDRITKRRGHRNSRPVVVVVIIAVYVIVVIVIGAILFSSFLLLLLSFGKQHVRVQGAPF